jgi:hypothetical protein
MPTPQEILASPDYQNANTETKKAIFDKHIAASDDFQNANDETKSAIKKRFGIVVEAKPSGKADAQKSTKGFIEEITSPRTPESLSIAKILEVGSEAAAVPATMAAGTALFPGTQPVAIPLSLVASGMFLSGAAGELTRQMGFSPLTQFGAEMVGGAGLEKTVTTGLYNAGLAAKNTLKGISDFNIKKIYEGVKSLGNVSEEQLAKQAAARQAKVFGEKTAEYIPGQTFAEASTKAQEDLAKEYKIGEAIYYSPSGKTAATKTKPGTTVATGKEDLTKPAIVTRTGTETTEKLEPYIRKQQIDTKTGKLENVSQTLRRELYDQVGKITVASPAERFSASPEFKDLQTKLQNRVNRGQITRAEKLNLERILKSDQTSAADQKVYGKTVDEQIRGWAGKMNAEGKTALQSSIDNKVRDDLRNSFASWTEKRGLGSIEKDYRAAFTKEKIAQAKDNIPRILAGYEGQAAMDQFVTQLSNDLPEAKNLMVKEMTKYFANIAPADIPKEFARLDKLMVRANLFKPEELQGIRESIQNLSKVELDKEAFGIKVKRILGRSLRRASTVEAVREVTNQ